MKISIIGCGALSRVFYLPILKEMGIKPYALADPNLIETKLLAKEFGAEVIAADFNEIIDGSDAAIIASPNYLHSSQAIVLMQKGKHVLLEKPMAASSEEAILLTNQLIPGVVLQIGMMRRFWKINQVIKQMLEDEIIGKITRIEMSEGSVFNWPVESTAVFNKEKSLGGVLIDTGSHTLDLLCWWLNSDDYDLEYRDDNKGGVEAECHLKIFYRKSEIEAEVKLSRIRNMKNEFFISGTKGWIKVKSFGNIFSASDKRINNYVYKKVRKKLLTNQSFNDLFREQITEWIKTITAGNKAFIDVASVLHSIDMIERCYKVKQPLSYNWE